MSKKVNWAEVDKRIRRRRTDFSDADMNTIEAALQKLPDLAEEVEIIDIPQPAVAPAPEEETADEDEAKSEEPN